MQQSGFLMVNRAQVLDATCNACGGRFAASAAGDKALTLAVGDKSSLLFFCASCGENIMAHLQSEEVRPHYGWDWAIPIRNGGAGGDC